jgi:hypothetical protein
MTGNQIVNAIRKAKGKINARVMMVNDFTWLYIEKADAIRHFKNYGDTETDMQILEKDGDYLLTYEVNEA